MDIECSQTYEYECENKEKTYIYENDLKYIKYNGIDINKVKDFPPNYNFSTIESRIDDCIKNNYEMLDFSHLKLDVFPEILRTNDKLYGLKHLFMGYNNIKSIDIKFFSNLVTVELSNNKLTSVPDLPKTIEELTITNNLIKTEDLYKYKHLKRLDISNNKLTSISVMKSLETLICADNNITEIKLYPKLKKLSCERNNIYTIDLSPNLEIIECNENKVTSIIGFLNLKEIYCSNNNITNISGLPLIDTLNCTKNKINSICYFPTLKELVCDYNSSMEISQKYNIIDTHIYDDYVVFFLE